MGHKIVDGVYKGKESYKCTLDLSKSPVTDLGCLESVGSNLDLSGTPIKSLGCLESVGGALYLCNTPIKSLGRLKSVGGPLDLEDCNITDLDCLEFVGNYLTLPDGTVVDHFSEYKKDASEILDGLSLEDYPLYMSHENWVVRSTILKGLEVGVHGND